MKRYKKLFCVLLSVLLVLSTFSGMQIQAATADTRYSKKYLQNGGFEENEEKYTWSSNYTQPQTVAVPYWDTTAYNTTGANGKLEFFKDNAAHFNQSSSNKVVAEGKIAAELNADEISTIYQRIETVSGSTYTWGLDHRGRDTTDTMVLFIGPEQYEENGTTPIDPSKPSKTGKDQFVKMTDWLKTQYGISYPAEGCSQKYTIYSKPFAAKGAFQNESSDADKNFSLTQTEECNQEWNLWVISSSNNNTSTDENVAVKGWSKYGTNCYDENEDSYKDVINGAGSKLGYDCTYTVPKGQTKTLFAFTSYSGNRKSGSTYIYDATYGNLLDDIQFKLYQPISSSITDGGTGGVHTGNATITSDIKNGELFFSTVTDGELCTIRTMKHDESDTYEFQGAYVTVYKDDGTPDTRFIPIYEGDIDRLTKEEKLELSKNNFLVDGTTTEENGVTKTWNYYFNVSVESPVHIHMMYTKAPYILYDSNGGEKYGWKNDNSAGGNLVGFRDGFKGSEVGEPSEYSDYYKDVEVKEIDNGDGTFSEEIKEGFYKSHAALPNENWNKNFLEDGSVVGPKFLGWAITGTDNKQVILDGVHTATYAPDTNGVGNIKFTDESNHNVTGLVLDATHGVTLTAQWQFGYTAQAQTLLGHALETQSWENSDVGGWVEETFINDRSNVTDYQDDYVAGRTERTDAYGSVGEKIIFRATPDSANDYVFDGWYTKEADGNYKLVTTTPNLAITVEEGKSTTYYARFKTKTVPVIFHYSESGSSTGYDYYEKDAQNKYGKYFQEVVYNETAVQPTGDSKSVTKWYTSETDRSEDSEFDFNNTPITKETHLYASPTFNFNYFNHLTIKGEGDPITPNTFSMRTYATLILELSSTSKEYVDVKNKADAYNVYLKTGTVGENKPSAKELCVDKNKANDLLFNSTTETGKTFTRVGTKYDYNFQTADVPVWVAFDFTYKGIKYTSPVVNRSMYNQLSYYYDERKSGYYTTYPKDEVDNVDSAHRNLLISIRNFVQALPIQSALTTDSPTSYALARSVSGLSYEETSVNNDYTFSSSTAVRNIEPWGFKYTFSVNEKDITDFDDYGCVVLTDSNSKYDNGITVSQLLNDSKSVMYSYDCENVYLSDDEKSIEAYYVNYIGVSDFDKNTYVVFFVMDENGYHFSNIVSNTYNEVLDKDVDNELAPLIKNYSESVVNYSNAMQSMLNSKEQA